MRMRILLVASWVVSAVCSRQNPPVIADSSMTSAVSLVGEDVHFNCRVGNIGRHMVAFVRAGTPQRLISFDEKIFRQRDKYEVRSRVGAGNDEWILTIKNAQESDRGNYSCQVNTDPVLVRTAELELRVPPSVSRSTPSAVEVREGHNVTLSCKAHGNPAPSVIWRRADRQIIRYNGATGFGASVFHGSDLQLSSVSRRHMGEYVCVASNGIPPDESWTVKLLVTFPPLLQPKQSVVRVKKGGLARLSCDAESWPRPDVVWERDGRVVLDGDNYATWQTVSGQLHSVHVLEIRKVRPEHFGMYRCTARNDNGIHHVEIKLEEAENDYHYTNSVQPEGSGAGSSDDEDATEERRLDIARERERVANTVATRPPSSRGRGQTRDESREELKQLNAVGGPSLGVALLIVSILFTF